MTNKARRDGLRSIGYYGGKSPFGTQGTGPWIASLLPVEKNTCYLEVFFGMGGVLLNRPKVRNEIVNDLNSRLINWARVVRDHPQIFGWLVEHTPFSREEFETQRLLIDDPTLTPLYRALAYQVCLQQNIKQGDGEIPKRNWKRQFSSAASPWKSDVVKKLSDRLRDVQIENDDALAILQRTEGLKDAVIYADPPYPESDTTAYLHSDIDVPAFIEAFKEQKGRVAISGYDGDGWEPLGWVRNEHPTHRLTLVRKGKKGKKTSSVKNSKRLELLWTNFQPAQGSMFEAEKLEKEDSAKPLFDIEAMMEAAGD